VTEPVGGEPALGVPDLATTVATLRMFASGSGALLVTIVIDQGPEHAPVVVSLDSDTGALEVAEADEARMIPDAGGLPEVEPIGRLHLHSFPPFEVDVELGQVAGVIGGLDHLAKAVIDLAGLFGGQSVASARYASTAGPPLEIGGSAGGEAALSCGGVEFETPDGWPGA